ncbi:MAG: AraC family transcriptional regulator [Polyangiales bacterium]
MRKYLGFSDPVLPTSYGLALVKLLGERGVTEAELLEGTEITQQMLRSPKARLSFEQMLRLIRRALDHSNDPGLGLELGRRITVSGMGVIGYAAMSQADLGSAIAIAEKYQRVLVPYLTLSARAEGEITVLQVEPEFPLGEYEPFVIEALLACVITVGRFLVGGSLTASGVRLSYPDPGYAERYREMLACPVEFGCPAVELRIESRLLRTPLAYACEPTARMTEELCERELAPLLGRDGVVHKVRSMLQGDDERFLNVRELAKALHTSERSLRRALSAHGTSYQELRDEVRMRLALHYLTSTATPVEEVARTVGFTSSRSFRRALKRWTGKSPSDVRAEG